VVEFDSIIPPGQEGKIIQQIKTAKLGTGTFSKSVRVLSNAQNNAEAVLTLSGKILAEIQPSHKWINLKPDSAGKFNGFITFATEKKDFKITEMIFEPQKKENLPLWQQDQGISIKYTVTKTDTADIDGYYTFAMNFSLNTPPPPEIIQGQFVFKTNHPKTDEIRLKGLINPRDEIQPNIPAIPENK